VAGNKTQRMPLLLPRLESIVSIAAGGNHAQALDSKGNVFICKSQLLGELFLLPYHFGIRAL